MKQWVPLFLMDLTGIFGYNLFFFIGLDMTSAINGSLIMATSPVFMTIGAVLFLHEEWNKRVGLGLILSLLGVLVVISQGYRSEERRVGKVCRLRRAREP